MKTSRKRDYTRWTLEAAAHFKVDPFLLGAMIYRESRCRPRKEELGGLGLTLLAPTMYERGFRRRAYRYEVESNGVWEQRTRPF